MKGRYRRIGQNFRLRQIVVTLHSQAGKWEASILGTAEWDGQVATEDESRRDRCDGGEGEWTEAKALTR